MFYYSTNAKKIILHFKKCQHVKAIKKENLATVPSVVEAQKQGIGISICKCCSTLGKEYHKNQKEIFDFAYKNGIRCYMIKGTMRVDTVSEKWLIVPLSNKESYELHHKNKFDTDRCDSIPGYHNQHFGSSSILEMLQYISEHEWYRMIHPLQIKHEKTPPKKGTKRWISQQKTQKKKERKKQIRNVLELIESLAV